MADHLENDVDLKDDAYDAFNEITGSDQDPDFDEPEASDQADDESDDSDNEQDRSDDDTDEQAPNDPDGDDGDDDPLAGLDEGKREYFGQLLQENSRLHNDVRANAGRVSALTKKLNELSEAQKKQAGDSLGDVPQLAGKNFEEVERDWPEVAEYVRTMVGEAVKHTRHAVQRDLQPLQQGYQSIQNSQYEAQREMERQRLSEVHNDWQNVVQSRPFNQWLSGQPQGVVQLMDSPHADDNIALLNLFKSSTGRLTPAAPAKPSRKADLSTHAELPRKGAGQPQSLPDDPAEYFDLITRPRRR